VGTEHLLLGLARLEEGTAMRILRDFGLDGETVRNAVIRMLSGPRPKENAPAAAPFVDVGLVAAALNEAMERLIEEHAFEAAARLRERQRQLLRLVHEIEADLHRYGARVPETPPRAVAHEYDVKTLHGASDTWAAQLEAWRRDGWELLSVVQEGGAVRAIVERRRRV
jgi:hypothetical protein